MTEEPDPVFETSASSLVLGMLEIVLQCASFLGVNDQTNLRITCKSMYKILEREYPFVVWENRSATTIGYAMASFPRPVYNEDVFSVVQLQEFNFLLHSKSSETEKSKVDLIQVKFMLQNELWDEQKNKQGGPECRPLGAFPSKTLPWIAVYIQGKPGQSPRKIFSVYPALCGQLWFGTVGSSNFLNPVELTTEEKEHLGQAMSYTWLCAKQIAVFKDGTEYPSAEYIMQSIPCFLRPFFPKAFDSEEAPNDRRTKPEFTYKPCPSMKRWLELVPWRRVGLPKVDLSKQSWYREASAIASDDESGDVECSSEDGEFTA